MSSTHPPGISGRHADYASARSCFEERRIAHTGPSLAAGHTIDPTSITSSLRVAFEYLETASSMSSRLAYLPTQKPSLHSVTSRAALSRALSVREFRHWRAHRAGVGTRSRASSLMKLCAHACRRLRRKVRDTEKLAVHGMADTPAL